jgi:hypothetical protein
MSTGSFNADVAFLKKHTSVVVLRATNGARVAVAPAYQGRVMTSAAKPSGPGNGWINFDLIQSGKFIPHINPFGGEDRFWLGPEGGQFSVFFAPGAAFDLAAWQTPPILDTEAFTVTQKETRSVTFEKSGSLTNYSGTKLDFGIRRTVRILDDTAIRRNLGTADAKGVSVVAYESENRLTNRGKEAWTKEGGLLSIWILGMLKHSATTTVIAPYQPGPESDLGPVVNDAYFGKVPANRLKVTNTHVFFKADGQYRSKIGFSPRRAKSVIGSYDPKRGLLTIVQFTFPKNTTEYVNSMWEIQDKPFGGDVSNSYNDGPPAPGAKPLGPFYELESSSPAFALAPGATGTHFHRTFHFSGPRTALNLIAKKVLGCDLSVLP